MTLKLDLHVHTIASGHAYNTILELVEEAKKKKMKVIAITDHTPLCSLTDEHYFLGLKNIPDTINGIRVLKGIELEVVDTTGKVAVSHKDIDSVDFVLLGFHPEVEDLDLTDKNETAEALIKGLKKIPKAKIISHPFSTFAEVDIIKISEYACKNNILLEVNLAHLNPRLNLKRCDMDRLKEMIAIVKKYNKKVIVNSDAHFITWLGDDSFLTPKLMKEIGLTKEMIINNYPKELEKILGVKF